MLILSKNKKPHYILLQNLKKEDSFNATTYPITPSTKRKQSFTNWISTNKTVINDMVEYVCERFHEINLNLKDSISGYTIYINKIKLFNDLSFFVYNQSSNKYNI